MITGEKRTKSNQFFKKEWKLPKLILCIKRLKLSQNIIGWEKVFPRRHQDWLRSLRMWKT